jgi:hypothetical protein
MTQLAVMSRPATWFGGQDQVIQASVLGLLSDEVLGELAAAKPAEKDSGLPVRR